MRYSIAENIPIHHITSKGIKCLIIEIGRQDDRQRRHWRYEVTLLVEVGGSYRLREKVME